MPAQRRKTFIVTLTRNGHTSTNNVLASDEARIRDWYTDLGFTVDAVVLKPRAPKGSRTDARRWTLDEAKLAEIIKFFGLKHPVYLTVGAGRRTIGYCQTTYGWHLPASAPRRYRSAGIVHRIVVSGLSSPESASRTLWHELAHAMQNERTAADHTDPVTIMKSIRGRVNAESLIPYRSRPCEVEARSYEEYAGEIAACV